MNPNPAPPSNWMQRLAARRSGGNAHSTLGSRIEVCPPELWPSSLSWRGALVRWFNQQVHRLPEPARPLNRLNLVKDDFLSSLSDVQHAHATVVAERITRARSLRELWHLRSMVYNLLASTYSQGEAEQRLARLNRHFPTRATRNHPQGLEA